MGTLINERKVLMAKATEFDKKYVAIDSKSGSSSTTDVIFGASNPYADKLTINDAAMKQLKVMAQSMFGQRKIRINLYEMWTFGTSVGGNILGSVTVDPSTITEFNSLAALFDEYRVVSGEYAFCVGTCTNDSSTTNPQIGVVGYDPAENISLTTVPTGAQLEQHKLFPIPMLKATNTAFSHVETGMHRFHFVVPPGVLVSSSGSAASNPTSTWQNTIPAAGSFYPYGWIKPWAGPGLLPVSSAGINGLGTYHCEFRSRS